METNDTLSALRQKELLLTVTENASVGVVILNRNRRYIFVNAAYCRILGLTYTANELIGKGPEVLGTVYQSQIEPRLDQSFAGKRVNYELTRTRPGASHGEVAHYTVVYDPIRNDAGAVDSVLVTIFDITKRTWTESVLSERGEQLRSFIEHSPVALAMFDRNMHYLHASRRWKSDLKMGEFDLRGRSHYELFPEIPERWKDIHRRGMAGETLRAEEDCFERSDGSKQWLRWEVRPWLEENGSVGGILIFFEEITVRKRAEAALRESEARFRAIFETEPECVKLLDADGALLAMNPAGLRMVEADSFEQIKNHCVYPLIVREHRDAFRRLTERVISGKSDSLEFEIIGLKGVHRWLETHASPMTNETGKIIAMLGVTRDITAHKEAAQELRKFAMLIECSSEFIGMCDLEMKPHYVNPAGVRMVGLSDRAAACRVKVQDYFFPEDQQFIAEEFFPRVLRDGEGNVEIRLRHFQTGEPIWMFYYLFNVRDASGKVIGWATVSHDITERRKSEAALRESEAQLREATKAANVGLWDWDLKTNAVWFSPEWKQQIGYEVEEISNRLEEWRNRVHPEDLDKAEARVRSYLDKPWPNYSTEFRFRHKNGSYRWIFAQASLIYGTDGKPVRMLGSHLDITERKQAEEAISRQKLRYELLLKTSKDAIHVVSKNGKLREWNGAFLSHLGYSADEARNLSVMDWDTQWNQNELIEKIEYLFQHGGTFETTHRRKDGSIRNVEISGAGFVFDNEELLLASARDTTERKRTEETLRERETQFRTVVEAMPVCLLMTDGSGQIRMVNTQVEKAFGYTRDELVGKPVELLVPQPIREFHSEYRREFMTNPQHRAMGLGRDLAGVRKDGTEFPVEVGLVPVSLDKSIYVLASIVDISARKQAEEERVKLEAQIRHAQKLESLGVLAGGIAHDFNNILSSVMGFSDLALMKLPPDSPVRPLIAKALNGTRSAAELTKQMLAYSGKGKFVVESININALIEDTFHLLHVSISKKSVLKFNLTPGLPAIEADAAQIRQVIMNLIINASDAIGDQSGVITASTGRCDRASLSETFLDDNLSEGLYVYLEVTDTGCGMSEDTRTRIFDPFFTTKATGRGLGLAAVLGIVRGHHGALNVTSEIGKGTTFKVAFPVDVAHTRKTPTLSTGGMPVETGWGSGTVLIVDDEETVREVVSDMLKTMGFSVLKACDGREGVEMFRNEGDKIRLVLLDLTMPNIDGIETFRAMRGIRNDMKAILSSGYNEQPAIHRSALDFAGFIQKPYTYKDLCAAIRSALGV